MKKNSKLNLSSLKVQSFVTSAESSDKIKGGRLSAEGTCGTCTRWPYYTFTCTGVCC